MNSVQQRPGADGPGAVLLARRLRLAQLGLAGGALAVAVSYAGDGSIFNWILAPCAAFQCAWCLTVATVEYFLRGQQGTLMHPYWLRAVAILDFLTTLAAMVPALAALGVASYLINRDNCAKNQFQCDRFWRATPKVFFLWLALPLPSVSFLMYDLKAYSKHIKLRP